MNLPPAEGLTPGTTVVVRGGNPSPEEAAALVLALDAAARMDAAPPLRRPAWQLAARREALGGGPVASPADLRG